MATQSTVKGALKVVGNPDAACFTEYTLTQLLQIITQFLGVEIQNQTFSNIVISTQQPGQADRDKIWWRQGNSGSFIGLYTYANNVWNQVYPAPGQVIWIIGDSDNPPAGFSFTVVSAAMTAPHYAALITQAVPAGPGPYVYFPTLYVGF